MATSPASIDTKWEEVEEIEEEIEEEEIEEEEIEDERVEEKEEKTVIIKTGPAPFNKLFTDLVLRTTDDTDFHVWRVILEEASPVFCDMFAIGKPSEVTLNDSKPIVALPETSAVLEPFLRMCYPLPPPSFPKFHALSSVVAIAHKYQADGVLLALKASLIKRAKVEPLRVYALAARYKMVDVANASAHHYLAVPAPAPYFEELEDMSAGAYHRLITYRHRCSVSISSMVESNWTWMGERTKPFVECSSCPTPLLDVPLYAAGSKSRRMPRRWIWDHYMRMGELLKDRPCSDTIEDPALLYQGIVDASPCDSCRSTAPKTLALFNRTLRAEVDRRIAKIPMPQILPGPASK